MVRLVRRIHTKKLTVPFLGKLKRVTKGMTGAIIELCSRNRTEELEAKLEQDVEGFATRGLRSLAVAYEELDGDDHESEGNGQASFSS